ncbi:arginine--tRNA ligase, partial [bacterium]|nr:arginine--tRNA ligase [bacterium]
METTKTKLVEAILKSLKSSKLVFKGDLQVSYPNIDSHGDYTTNVAMQIANLEANNPLETAEKLKASLLGNKFINKTFSKIEVAKPGFINFFFSPEFLSNKANKLLKSRKEYGLTKLGKGKSVQVEFISANPTGPLTLGNGRGGFYGDVLGNVLKRVGYDVQKEYLVNDAGNQIKILGHSVLKDQEAQYKGQYIDDLNKELGSEKDVKLVGKKAAEIILNDLIKKTVKEKMQITFDDWFHEEKELKASGKIDKIIKKVKEGNHTYEKDKALWFKSEELGDTRDRVLIKSNGDTTYLAQDFAYAESKFGERRFDKGIYVWGADHHGDVSGLLNAVKVLGYEGRAEVILTQFVKLIKDGKEVRMSKRSGDYVTMSELIDLVGHDVVRFIFLMYSNSTHMEFDLSIAEEKSEKNPVYNVQYVSARMNSILNQIEISESRIGNSKINLDEECEINLVRALLKWPEILEEISTSFMVQLLPKYAIEIANNFHRFYD